MVTATPLVSSSVGEHDKIIFDEKDAWCGPCRPLGDLAFVPAVDVATQFDRAAVGSDAQRARVRSRGALESGHNTLAHVASYGRVAEFNLVIDARHTGDFASCLTSGVLLIIPVKRSDECHITLLDLHRELVLGDGNVPRKDIEDPACNFLIACLRIEREANFKFLSNALYVLNALGRVLRRHLLGVVGDEARESNDAAFGRHADMSMVDARIPNQLVHHVALQFAVGFHHHPPQLGASQGMTEPARSNYAYCSLGTFPYPEGPIAAKHAIMTHRRGVERDDVGSKPTLFALEAHLDSILETVPDAMIVIDERGLILSFSAAAERMFGYSEAELLGENVSTLMPSPDRERHDHYLENYLATGEKRIIGIGRITAARRRSGVAFPIDLHIGEARAGAEKVFTGFIRDLTERQATQRRLHDLQAELAHVARVTAMGTLATALAHELNQPLTAIANYVETARDLLHDPNDEVLETVRGALNECAMQSVRAGQIVRRLRDYISRGEVDRKPESLNQLVSESSVLAMIGAGERGVEIEVKLESACDEIFVDRIQIQQVILNLVRNAFEAMDGSPDRRIRISSCRENSGSIRVTIADSGPGLEPEMAGKLFEPFNSTKTQGMGLGLSICHTIIRGHAGRIWAEASSLGGTAFHFTLPKGAEE